jgi:AraC-like DNA-binding protein
MEIFVYCTAILGMFMTIILFIFFLITPKGNKHENRILAALLIVFGFQIFIALSLGKYGFRHFYTPHLYLYILKLTCFTSGPLIFHYVKTSLGKTKSFKFNLFHFIPFLCCLIFFGYFKFDVDLIGRTSVILNLLCLSQNLVYIAFSIYYIRKSRVPIKSILTDFKGYSILTWIHIILLGYITVWIIQLNSLSIYVILRQPNWCAYTSSICILTILIFTLLIMFLLLLKPEIYYGIKYKTNHLDDLSKGEYLTKLNDYFKLEKPYLNPDISLEKVATDISIKPRMLSQVINEFCKKNFKGFVNDFRINECVRLFAEDTNSEKTIQEVYYMAGFNSRSVFNELFKEHTGLTPKEYKDKQNQLRLTK